VLEPTFIERGLNVAVNARLNGVDGLIPSIMDCQRFKALSMAWSSVDFKRVNNSSFCNITFSKPSSFDVPSF
jgi:hypothetical protein